jgi:hypothetical protein
MLPKKSTTAEGVKLEMCVGPFVLQVTYSASYRPGRFYGAPEDCYEDEFELEVESIYSTAEGNDYDEDAGPWLSQQALDAIQEKCEQDFSDNMAIYKQSNDDARAEYLADQAQYRDECRAMYREVD